MKDIYNIILFKNLFKYKHNLFKLLLNDCTFVSNVFWIYVQFFEYFVLGTAKLIFVICDYQCDMTNWPAWPTFPACNHKICKLFYAKHLKGCSGGLKGVSVRKELFNHCWLRKFPTQPLPAWASEVHKRQSQLDHQKF